MAGAGSAHRHPLTLFGLLALLGLGLVLLWPASLVFLVSFAAVLLAVLIDGLARLINHWTSMPQQVGRLLVIALLLALTALFFILAGPRLSDQLSQLSERLPQAIEHFQNRLAEQPWGRRLAQIDLTLFRPSEAQILAGVTGVFSTAVSALANIVVVFIIGMYLAVQPDIYVRGLLHLVPHAGRDRAQEVLNMLGHALSWWLVGRFASMAAVGVLTTLALSAIDMPLALVLGVIAGLFSFVPYIGPISSAVPAILIGLTESPWMAVYVVVIYAVIQFLEGNFITPLIQRRAVSLAPAVLLFSQFAMAVFYGLFGVLLATPLAIVLIVLVQMLYVQDVVKDPIKVLGEHPGGRT